MIFARNFSLIVLVFALSFIPPAQASTAENSSFADSAITVAGCTVAGAILGASTLPFYEESGEHTKNIFYGAAFGAVVGVMVAAYAGVKDGPNYEEARLKRTPNSQLSLNEAPELRLHAEASTAQKKPAAFGEGSTLFWSPLAQVHF